MGFRHSGIAFHGYFKFVDRQRLESPKERGELLAKSLLVRRSPGKGNLRCETRKEERGVRRAQGEYLRKVACGEVAKEFMDNCANIFWVALRCGYLKNDYELARALFPGERQIPDTYGRNFWLRNNSSCRSRREEANRERGGKKTHV